ASRAPTRWESWADGQSPDGRGSRRRSRRPRLVTGVPAGLVVVAAPRGSVPRTRGPERGSMRDDEAMAQALQVSAAARRRSAPNPWVGCVLVQGGEHVGEGASLPEGGPHAEAAGRERDGDRGQRP